MNRPNREPAHEPTGDVSPHDFGDDGVGGQPLRVTIGVVFSCVFVASALEAQRYPPLARYLPQVVAVIGAALTVALAIREVMAWRELRSGVEGPGQAGRRSDDADANQAGHVRRSLVYILVFLGYGALVALINVVAATFIFVAAFFYLSGQLRSWLSVPAGALAALVQWAMIRYMGLEIPSSLLEVVP